MNPEPAPRRVVLSTTPINPANPPCAPWPPDGMSPLLRLELLALKVVMDVLAQLDERQRTVVLMAIRKQYGDAPEALNAGERKEEA
jgi:hypothetical protein